MAEANRELADFLRRARGRVDPSRAGLPADGRVRRVPGLRREEVAFLAGVSSDYYTRLEQGRPIVPSPAVVEALARALGLDAAGRSHLQTLLDRHQRATPPRTAAQRARPSLSQFVDALDAPALVLGRRTDVLAQNRGSRALIADFDALPARERNYVRWMTLSDEASRLFVDWDEQARAAVESLRLDVGRHPDDAAAQSLVAELSAASETFGRWWEAHGVHQRTHGTKRLNHPTVGRLDVHYETLTLPGDDDQTLFVYTAAPGSPSSDALALLAS